MLEEEIAVEVLQVEVKGIDRLINALVVLKLKATKEKLIRKLELMLECTKRINVK